MEKLDQQKDLMTRLALASAIYEVRSQEEKEEGGGAVAVVVVVIVTTI